MKKISNIKASEYTSQQIEFKGSNTFGEWKNDCYTVYSYGYHFPMYVFKGGKWYENSNKYSQTTSKQQTQLRPYLLNGTSFILKNTDELKELIRA